MNDWVSMCDEVIHADAEAKSYNEETKTLPKNIISGTKRFYILVAFLLITIALLTAVGIYCYLIKYKQNKNTHYHFMPYLTNKEVLY